MLNKTQITRAMMQAQLSAPYANVKEFVKLIEQLLKETK
jgi:hypothetical protein